MCSSFLCNADHLLNSRAPLDSSISIPTENYVNCDAVINRTPADGSVFSVESRPNRNFNNKLWAAFICYYADECVMRICVCDVCLFMWNWINKQNANESNMETTNENCVQILKIEINEYVKLMDTSHRSTQTAAAAAAKSKQHKRSGKSFLWNGEMLWSGMNTWIANTWIVKNISIFIVNSDICCVAAGFCRSSFEINYKHFSVDCIVLCKFGFTLHTPFHGTNCGHI